MRVFVFLLGAEHKHLAIGGCGYIHQLRPVGWDAFIFVKYHVLSDFISDSGIKSRGLFVQTASSRGRLIDSNRSETFDSVKPGVYREARDDMCCLRPMLDVLASAGTRWHIFTLLRITETPFGSVCYFIAARSLLCLHHSNYCTSGLESRGLHSAFQCADGCWSAPMSPRSGIGHRCTDACCIFDH